MQVKRIEETKNRIKHTEDLPKMSFGCPIKGKAKVKLKDSTFPAFVNISIIYDLHVQKFTVTVSLLDPNIGPSD